MKLQQVQAALPDRTNHEVLRRVDKDAHLHDERREFSDEAGGSLHKDTTGAWDVEDKAQRVSTRPGGGPPISKISDAADFDFNRHCVASASHVIRPGTTAQWRKLAKDHLRETGLAFMLADMAAPIAQMDRAAVS